MTETPFIHEACPRKLKTAYKRAKDKDGTPKPYNMRALARQLGINIYYVSRAIRLGERPENKAIADILFFAREYKRRAGEPKPEPPEHIKWWRSLSRQHREEWIRSAYDSTSDRTPL